MKLAPEAMQVMQDRAARIVKAKSGVSAASKVQKSNLYSTASSVLALGSMRHSRALPSSAPISYESIQKSHTSRQKSARSHAANVLDLDDDDEEEAVRDFHEIENEMQTVFALDITGAEAPQAFDRVLDEMRCLLSELEQEPSNDEELSAKFALYENFFATVEDIRKATFSFWADNKDMFSGDAQRSAEKLLVNIDSERAQGIPDDDRVWFVYWMTKQAGENSSTIQSVLATLKTRLELLSQDDLECPFCLEKIPADNETALGCCHKACTTCWQHWLVLKGNGAFCPLCKHNDFIAFIIQANHNI
jgi:hypothetical protein